MVNFDSVIYIFSKIWFVPVFGSGYSYSVETPKIGSEYMSKDPIDSLPATLFIFWTISTLS